MPGRGPNNRECLARVCALGSKAWPRVAGPVCGSDGPVVRFTTLCLIPAAASALPLQCLIMELTVVVEGVEVEEVLEGVEVGEETETTTGAEPAVARVEW